MADTKISALTAATTPLGGTEAVPLVQSGNTRRATADDMAPTLRAEVVAARDGEASLSAKLAAIEASIPSGGGAPFHGWVSGSYVTQALVAGALSTISGASNRLEVMPWQPQRDMTVDQISVYVTATGAADFRLVIYSSDANGLPGDLLWNTADTTPSSTGEIAFSPPGGGASYTFTEGTTYWIGWHTETSGAGTHKAVPIGAVSNLGLTSIAATQGCQVLRTTATFASGAPDPFPTPTTGMLTQSTTPLAFCFRIA